MNVKKDEFLSNERIAAGMNSRIPSASELSEAIARLKRLDAGGQFWMGDWRLAMAEERVAMAEERLARAEEQWARAMEREGNAG